MPDLIALGSDLELEAALMREALSRTTGELPDDEDGHEPDVVELMERDARWASRTRSWDYDGN